MKYLALMFLASCTQSWPSVEAATDASHEMSDSESGDASPSEPLPPNNVSSGPFWGTNGANEPGYLPGGGKMVKPDQLLNTSK